MCDGAARRAGFRSAISTSASGTRMPRAIRRRASSSSTPAASARPRSCYGSVRFASKIGQLAGNHFLTIVAEAEQLPKLGRLTVWQGAQLIAFEAI
jgi:hypothetical protein